MDGNWAVLDTKANEKYMVNKKLLREEGENIRGIGISCYQYAINHCVLGIFGYQIYPWPIFSL